MEHDSSKSQIHKFNNTGRQIYEPRGKPPRANANQSLESLGTHLTAQQAKTNRNTLARHWTSRFLAKQ